MIEERTGGVSKVLLCLDYCIGVEHAQGFVDQPFEGPKRSLLLVVTFVLFPTLQAHQLEPLYQPDIPAV